MGGAIGRHARGLSSVDRWIAGLISVSAGVFVPLGPIAGLGKEQSRRCPWRRFADGGQRDAWPMVVNGMVFRREV